MSTKPPGYENLVTCPYNKVHQIENGRRFQTHLIKCRKEYEKNKTTAKTQCPFNATHIINEPEFKHHVETCPDRVIVDKFQMPIVDSMDALQKVKPVKMITNQFNTEDWDEEEVTPAYDPQKYCESNNIIRGARGMQPHERKAFRQQEHIRLGQIREHK